MDTVKHDLYAAAMAADDAWQAELVRVYKGRAGDARYSYELGVATPELARLASAFAAASDALQRSWVQPHNSAPGAELCGGITVASGICWRGRCLRHPRSR